MQHAKSKPGIVNLNPHPAPHNVVYIVLYYLYTRHEQDDVLVVRTGGDSSGTYAALRTCHCRQ